MANESWLEDLYGYRRVRDPNTEGSAMPQRAQLAFTGGVVVSDDGVSTVVHVPQGVQPGGDGESVGLKAPCRVATTAPVPLSGLGTIDGIPLANDDRVLVRAQSDPAANGIYVASEIGWTRADDADGSGELRAMSLVPVNEGTAYADTVWMMTAEEPVIIGTTPLTFARVGSGDAESLRGSPIDPAAPLDNQVLVYSGGTYYPLLVTDPSVHEQANIAVSKLAPSNTDGQILRTLMGTPVWTTMSPADLGENVVDPPTLGTDQDNYSPAGWSGASVVRLKATVSGIDIRGFGPASVKRKTLVNAGVHDISLWHLATGQVAGNQVILPGGSDGTPFVLRVGESATILYDSVVLLNESTVNGWRLAELDLLNRPAGNTYIGPQVFRGGARAENNSEFLYDQTVGIDRVMVVPIFDLTPLGHTAAEWIFGDWPIGGVNEGTYHWLSAALSDELAVEVRLPHDSRVMDVEAYVGSDNGAAVIKLEAWLRRLTTTSRLPTLTQIGTTVYGPGADAVPVPGTNGDARINVGGSGGIPATRIDAARDLLRIRLTTDPTTAALFRVFWVRVLYRQYRVGF